MVYGHVRVRRADVVAGAGVWVEARSARVSSVAGAGVCMVEARSARVSSRHGAVAAISAIDDRAPRSLNAADERA